MTPYRSPPPEWSSAAPIHATAWTTSRHHARIGKCEATIHPERRRGVAPYWSWRVSRDSNAVVVFGSAMTLESAKVACERGADLLSESGWPTAWAPGGFIT
jgi:hypothetical protein